MEVSEVKQRLLTDLFTYYPMGAGGGARNEVAPVVLQEV